ncbi:MAG: hypothetical protein OXH52_03970, partial [Gammaproteobacteria bacterium]|nr:hypothetical protein [Gammaproteobacteria bacterium]
MQSAINVPIIAAHIVCWRGVIGTPPALVTQLTIAALAPAKAPIVILRPLPAAMSRALQMFSHGLGLPCHEKEGWTTGICHCSL